MTERPNGESERDLAPTVAVDESTAMAPAVAQESWIGRIIDDRYRVVELLGEGGMGAVYVAEHLKLHKQVALKVIRAQFAGDGDLAARFAREAMAAAQFEHPHVASAIDYGTLAEGGAYLVMQLVRGRSLTEVLQKRGRLGWAKAAEIGAQIADALSAAAAAGIVHRDLKPDNVLIQRRDDGTDLVKILDFGIAHVPVHDRAAPEGAKPDEKLTRIGAIVGTPGYMSPEQAVGDPVDPRADLYALGVVLWESMVGRRLWEASALTDLVKRQLSETPLSLREATGDETIPPELEAVVAQLLQRSVGDRPERAGMVRDRLRQVALSVVADRYSAIGAEQTDASAAEDLAPRSRGKLGLLIVGLIGATLITLALGIAIGRRPPEAVPVALPPLVTESIPPAIAEDVDALLGSDRRKDRDLAAQRVLEHAAQTGATLPAYVTRVAALLAARGCPAKKTALAEVVALNDKRVVPTLERLARSPKYGCGEAHEQDCLSCIREDLDRALTGFGVPVPIP